MSLDLIIQEVKIRPELWCKQNKGFRNRPLHNELWADIASKLQMDETLIRKRWKHLKDQYRKELKKTPEIGPDNKEFNGWLHYDSMEFMRPTLLKSKKRSHSETEEEYSISEFISVNQNREIPDIIEPDLTGLNTINSKVSRLSHLVQKHMTRCDEDLKNDSDFMFLKSLLPSMKSLNEIQKLQFRGKVNDWLLEAATQNQFAQCDNKFLLQTQLLAQVEQNDD